MMGYARGNADDPPAFLRPHQINDGQGAEKISSQVRVDDPIPILLLHFRHEGAQIDAGIVYEDIDAAEAAQNLFDKTLYRRFPGDIHLDGKRLAAAGL